jgi:hypothetical protein
VASLILLFRTAPGRRVPNVGNDRPIVIVNSLDTSLTRSALGSRLEKEKARRYAGPF